MSGKDVQLYSDSLPNKCGRECGGVDRISQLPDDIIVHILSFLPLREAVVTSLVSPRWSHLWRYTPNLIFRNHPALDDPINIPVTLPEHMRSVRVDPVLMRSFKNIEWVRSVPVDPVLMRSLKNIEWVNMVLNLHKALTLKKFEISFYMHEDSSHYQVLAKWLHFALLRQVESLKLNLLQSPLILNNIFSDIPTSKYKFLKELKLKNLNVRGEAIELFLCNCPSLEHLTMMPVNLMSDLVVVGGALNYFAIECGGEVSTTIDAPNLTRLSCKHALPKLFLKNVPNLVEASFLLVAPDDTMDRFAKAAAKLEILTIAVRLPEVFPVPQMPKLKKLFLNYTVVSRTFLLPVTCLLQASPCLQEFRIEVKDLNPYYERKHRIKRRIFEVPKVGMFPPHHHLKVFEFSGFCVDVADHMELLSYIVENCVRLEEIVLITLPALAIPDPTKYGRPPHTKEKIERKRAHNPFLLYPSSYDEDVLEREADVADLYIKELTEQRLADKIPHHIKLVVKILDDPFTLALV